MTKQNRKNLREAAGELEDLMHDVSGVADFYFEDEAAADLEVHIWHIERVLLNLKHICAVLKNPAISQD
jgi:hypothetical protein